MSHRPLQLLLAESCLTLAVHLEKGWHLERACAQVLGDYYARDSRNVFKALWQDYEACCFVRPDKEGELVYWYTN